MKHSIIGTVIFVIQFLNVRSVAQPPLHIYKLLETTTQDKCIDEMARVCEMENDEF